MELKILRKCYQSLLNSLILVAADYEDQVSSLPSFVVVADEVSTTYGEAFYLVNQLEEAGFINKHAEKLLKDLDNWFDYSPEGEVLDTLKSLKENPYWEKARNIAQEILKELKIQHPYLPEKQI